MFEVLEKTLLLGLGAVALSQKKAEELLQELKGHYTLSEEEGKAFLAKIQTIAKEGKDRVAEMAEDEVQQVIGRIGLVAREEFDRLQNRIAELEKKMAEHSHS